MKIGVEVQRLFRKNKFGIETSSLELIRKLVEVEPQHEYVIFAKDDEDRKCLAAAPNLKVRCVKGKFFADFEQFFLPIAAREEQVDLLHCTGNTAPYFSSAPIIQTLHDVIFMDDIPSKDTLYQRFGNHYRRKIVPLVTGRSKAVITVSQFEKERIIRRLGISRDKVHVIYNGINEERFNTALVSNPEAIRSKYRLPEKFILFLGNLAIRKNATRVIEAYVRYRSMASDPLPIVTPGLPQKFVVETLQAMQYPYRPSDFITPGYIDEADLPDVYRMSDLFLFPSLSEGFGMPIVEAMACGTPVISSGISCMPEISGNAALLVDPYAPTDLAGAIHRMVSDPALRAEKITQGLVNARRFNWTRTANQVLTIYDKVFQQVRNPKHAPVLVKKQFYATRD